MAPAVRELTWNIDPTTVQPGRVALATLRGPGLGHGRRRPGIVPVEVFLGLAVAVGVIVAQGDASPGALGLVVVLVGGGALGLRWKALRDGHASHRRTLRAHTVTATASGVRVKPAEGPERRYDWADHRVAGGWRCPVVQQRSAIGSAGVALPATGLATWDVTPKQAARVLRGWAKAAGPSTRTRSTRTTTSTSTTTRTSTGTRVTATLTTVTGRRGPEPELRPGPPRGRLDIPGAPGNAEPDQASAVAKSVRVASHQR